MLTCSWLTPMRAGDVPLGMVVSLTGFLELVCLDVFIDTVASGFHFGGADVVLADQVVKRVAVYVSSSRSHSSMGSVLICLTGSSWSAGQQVFVRWFWWMSLIFE